MTTNTALIPVDQAPQSTFWQRFGRGLLTVGRLLGRGGVAVGEAASSAYSAIDPDARRHIAQLPLVGLSMLMPRAPDVVALPDDGSRPVVFVHGLGGKPGNFVAMKAYFAMLGRTRVYLVDLTRAGSFDEMSKRVRRIIEEVAGCNQLGPEDQVDVVAHSMGGIAARLALTDPETAKRVHTLITLGTPHSGTHLARFAATDVTLDLRPKSPLMQRLASTSGPTTEVRTVAMWSRADVFMLPAESARWEGAENVEVLGFTHYAYLLKRRGWKTVFELLAEPAEDLAA